MCAPHRGSYLYLSTLESGELGGEICAAAKPPRWNVEASLDGGEGGVAGGDGSPSLTL